MSEVIVITSGKGGVGKTTTTANVGTGLAQLNKKVVLIDTDIGLRNLDVVMGLDGTKRQKLHYSRSKTKNIRIYVFCRQHRPEINPRYLRSRCRH